MWSLIGSVFKGLMPFLGRWGLYQIGEGIASGGKSFEKLRGSGWLKSMGLDAIGQQVGAEALSWAKNTKLYKGFNKWVNNARKGMTRARERFMKRFPKKPPKFKLPRKGRPAPGRGLSASQLRAMQGNRPAPPIQRQADIDYARQMLENMLRMSGDMLRGEGGQNPENRIRSTRGGWQRERRDKWTNPSAPRGTTRRGGWERSWR